MQVRLFYGLQVIEINQLIHCISYKVYYVNFRKIKNLTINNNKELKYDFIENLVLDTKIGFPKATRS